MSILKLFLVLFLTLTFSVKADVFTLFPKIEGSGVGITAEELTKAIGAKKLWTEKVIINGLDTELGLNMIDSNIGDVFKMLKKLYSKAKFINNKNSVLMELKLPNGVKRRVYLLQLGKEFPVIQFSMDVPKQIPKNFSWPNELPLPAGSTPDTYMYFPKRDAFYGYFETVLDEAGALVEISNTLAADGWKPVTGEAQISEHATGEVFINKGKILIANFSRGKNGKVAGSIYVRPVGK